MEKKKPWLSFIVITLALSVAFSFVAISHLLIKSGKETPSASIDISVSDNYGNNESDNDNNSQSYEEEDNYINDENGDDSENNEGDYSVNMDEGGEY